MKIKRYRIIFTLYLISNVIAHSESVRFGGDAGWNHTISNGIREIPGWRGEDALTLSPVDWITSIQGGGTSSNVIDFILVAESESLRNIPFPYHLKGNYAITHHFSTRGNKAIRPDYGGIELHPVKAAMWTPGTQWDEFTLDFLLRPIALRDGEIFFSWRGLTENGLRQTVMARVEKRRIVWTFDNFFRLGTEERGLKITLSSSLLIPQEWRHHRIRFSSNNTSTQNSSASPGLLEYLIDGTLSDVTHTTLTGQEGSEIFVPHIGSRSDQPILLAPNFNGYIDEVLLVPTPLSQFPMNKYVFHSITTHGIGRTQIIDTAHPGSIFQGIQTRFETPGSSRIRFFVRAFESQDALLNIGFPNPQDPNWHELTMRTQDTDPMGFGQWYRGIGKESLSGRYFSIGYILHPDAIQDLAPLLSIMEFDYKQRFLPLTPLGLSAEKQEDGTMVISWNPQTEDNIVGWWLSWGDRPKSYMSGNLEKIFHGMVWIPRRPEDTTESPHFTWPDMLRKEVIYASVRAAWEEGKPSPLDKSKPMDYNALGLPSQEISFQP